MSIEEKNEWSYRDDISGLWKGPISEVELHRLGQAGIINDSTSIVNNRTLTLSGLAMYNGIPYSNLIRSNLLLTPSPDAFHAERIKSPVTVISGLNNCGKSYLLKQLLLLIGQSGYLIASNRFSNLEFIGSQNINRSEHRQLYDQFSQQFKTSKQNVDENQFRLDQIIATLNDHQRDRLFRAFKDLLGYDISLKQTEKENKFSPYYIDLDGKNIRFIRQVRR